MSAELPPVEKPSLEYDTTDRIPVRRPRWVWAVVGLYGLCLVALVLFPVGMHFFVSGFSELPEFMLCGAFSSFLLLVGVSLMMIPVRAQWRRPVSRGSVWVPIAGSSVLVGLLCFVGIWAVADAFPWAAPFANANALWYAAGVWLLWVVVFGVAAISLEPLSLSVWVYRWLVMGTVLELVVAVPMHVIARRRTECCAGIASGVAIGVGVMVAVVAIGPGVFFLFYRRWKRYYAVKRSEGAGGGGGSF